MKTYPVKILLTHLRPHLSDIASFWLLLRWGERYFPGVSDSEIRYLTTGTMPDDMPPEVLEDRGVLPIGVGGGPLDEHPVDGIPRKVGECEATLTAKAIRKRSDRTLSPILGEILHCDLTRDVRPTQLATLVKVRHRHHQNDPQTVIDWTCEALDALYDSGARSIHRETHRGVLRDMAENSVQANGWKNEHALKHLRALISESEGRDHLCTDLAHVFKVLFEREEGAARKWVSGLVSDIYHDGCSFMAAVHEVNDCEEIMEFSSERETFPVIAIASDNEHISQASRSRHCGYIALTIQRNNRGNVAIFLNVLNEHVQREGLNLGNLIRMLRLREQALLGHPQGQWEVLGADGSLRRVRMWYYSKDADQILNGGLSAPDVPPTRISLRELLEIAQSAFKRELVLQWRWRYARASELQRRRGGFRIASRHMERRTLFAETNLQTIRLPARSALLAELERIMVPRSGSGSRQVQ